MFGWRHSINMLPIITQNGHTIHVIFDFLLINHTTLCSNIQQSTFPHPPWRMVRPFSPEREMCCVLSIWMLMHSYGMWLLYHQPYFPILQHCWINYPPDRLLGQSADNYFMLYLAESLTGKSYTEEKLLRYFPLWRERDHRRWWKVESSMCTNGNAWFFIVHLWGFVLFIRKLNSNGKCFIVCHIPS